jgi:hypothetical protein
MKKLCISMLYNQVMRIDDIFWVKTQNERFAKEVGIDSDIVAESRPEIRFHLVRYEGESVSDVVCLTPVAGFLLLSKPSKYSGFLDWQAVELKPARILNDEGKAVLTIHEDHCKSKAWSESRLMAWFDSTSDGKVVQRAVKNAQA